MSRYWVYVNDRVSGPYVVEKLIRIPGFSRKTMVCSEEAGVDPKNWITAAYIPELSKIFRTIDEMNVPAPPQALNARLPDAAAVDAANARIN